MKQNTLEFLEMIETIFKNNKLLWTKIQIIEDIDYDKNKVKYSRKKYTINEIDLQANWVKFWVSNWWGCTTVDIYAMFMYLIDKKILQKDWKDFLRDILLYQLKLCLDSWNNISRKTALFLIDYLKLVT